GLDDRDDLAGIAAEAGLADPVARAQQRNGHAVRRQRGAVVDVVHPLERVVLPAVDLEDHLVRTLEPGLVVADRGRGHERAVLADRRDLDHRDVERAEKALPGHRRDLREVHVEVFHLAAVDLLAGDRVGVVRQAELDALRPGQRAVELRSGRGAGPYTDAELAPGRVLGLDPRGKRLRHGLGIARSGKTAQPDRVAGVYQGRGLLRGRYPGPEAGARDPVAHCARPKLWPTVSRSILGQSAYTSRRKPAKAMRGRAFLQPQLPEDRFAQFLRPRVRQLARMRHADLEPGLDRRRPRREHEDPVGEVDRLL